MQLFSRAGATVNFRGATVLLPSLAAGHVGETAVEELIQRFPCKHVGWLEDANILPMVGKQAPRSGSRSATSLCPVATALEVYRVESEGGATPLYIIQQRAPAMAGRQAAAACALATLLKTEGVATAIVLCGLDSQLRRDQEIEGPEVRFMGTSDLEDVCKGVPGVVALDPYLASEENTVHALIPPWPLVRQFKGVCALHYVLLCAFVQEGDNSDKAHNLAEAAARVLVACKVLL
ncbi:hypothetical protein V8C86DRAFT_2979862 [Haematococcus lacustris]